MGETIHGGDDPTVGCDNGEAVMMDGDRNVHSSSLADPNKVNKRATKNKKKRHRSSFIFLHSLCMVPRIYLLFSQ